MEHRQLVIIGSGPAGLSAAIYARRAGLDTLVVESGLAGGQANNTAEIENYPGFPHVDGMALARALRAHAEKFAPDFRDCRVVSLDLGDGKVVRTSKGDVSADAVIIASGATHRRGGFVGEEQFAGRGVSYCAVCDGAFFRDMPVVVIGGGNTAVEEAVYLTQFASKVFVVHRRGEFRADRTAVERAEADPKVEFVMNSTVNEVRGTDVVERVVVSDVGTGESREIEAGGVFVFVGTTPVVDFLGEGSPIARAPGGWITTDERMATNVPGVFAAGDVRDKYLRQIVTAASDGAVAAMAAYDFIAKPYFARGR